MTDFSLRPFGLEPEPEPEVVEVDYLLLRVRALELAVSLYDRNPTPPGSITGTADTFYHWLLGEEGENESPS